MTGQTPHQRGVAPGRPETFAVDEYVPCIEHHSGTAIEAHGPRHSPLCRARFNCFKPDIGFGLGEIFAQSPPHRIRILERRLQGIARKLDHLHRNFPGLINRRLLRIPVHGDANGIFRILGQTLKQLTRQLTPAGLPETNGVSHAFAHGNTVMRVTRRQIQHIPRLQHKFLLRHKLGKNLQRNVRLQAQVFLTPDPPAPTPLRLQQKNVITVKMRPDATPVSGVTDHQVIQPGIGHETEFIHQVVNGFTMQVNPLQQNRPTRTLQRRQGAPLERPMLETPARRLPLLPNYHACLNILAGRQLKQFTTIQQRPEVGNGLPHQQGLFLPVPLHEYLRAQTTQQWQGLIYIHINLRYFVKLRQFCLMEIKQQCVVALTWTLKDTLGEELDVLDEPVEFLVGGEDLFDVIEEALQGHEVGATLELQIEPEQGFGDFNDQLVFLERRELFPPELEEGMTLEGVSLPAGCNPDAPKDVLFTVAELYPEHVVLDGNHPLAGIALRLHLKVQAVREATEEEIGRGTAGTGFFKIQPVHAIAPGSDTRH